MGWREYPKGRSVPCNGEAVKSLRERRGWTQQELATQAGYSSRVIAKAEGGGSLHPDTVATLADALSHQSAAVHPEDLVVCIKTIARKIIENYAEYERDCAKHCTQYLADDFEFVVPGDPNVLPFCGTYHGSDGFEMFWERFFAVMQRHDKRVILDSMRVVGDGHQVVILTSECASFVGQPPPHPVTPIGFFFEFERGKIKRMEDHFDAAAAQQKVKQLLKDSAEARAALEASRSDKPEDGRAE